MNQRRFLISIGAAVGVALIMWFMPLTSGDREATIIAEPMREPELVTWDGTIIGVLESGHSLALERSDGSGAFTAVLAEPAAGVPEGTVRVSGILGEDTCAYRNTVFAGECVPQLLDAVIDGIIE